MFGSTRLKLAAVLCNTKYFNEWFPLGISYIVIISREFLCYDYFFVSKRRTLVLLCLVFLSNVTCQPANQEKGKDFFLSFFFSVRKRLGCGCGFLSVSFVRLVIYLLIYLFFFSFGFFLINSELSNVISTRQIENGDYFE